MDIVSVKNGNFLAFLDFSCQRKDDKNPDRS